MIATAICVTAGRTKFLREALACFEAQDYAEKRMVILNTFPRQALRVKNPLVQVINMEVRPRSLGYSRNVAVGHAEPGIMVIWDDDDLYLPHHLRLYAEAFEKTGADWVRATPTFYSEGYSIKKTFSSWVNSVAFTKAAFDKIDGYPDNLSVGEDQVFFSKLSQQCKGVTLELKPSEISAIYGWGNNAYHVSGKGPDRPGEKTAWERYQLDLNARVLRGEEPTGEIQITPKLDHDPQEMVKTYLAAQIRPGSKKEPLCFVQLGRYGDIINVLPIFYHAAQVYDKPRVMVSKQFADIFDGVSYVDPVIVPLTNDQINAACGIAQKQFKHVINCQIWGKQFHQEKQTESYNKESWRTAGFSYKFDDLSWYPIFDRRDYAKEDMLAQALFLTTRPKIIVNVSSVSSPFNQGKELLARLHQEFDEWAEVVDVTNLRVDHVYDMLGIIDRASCVVSADSSLIHLTAGTNTPLVALTNPAPWQGSIPRCEHFKTYNYGDVTNMLASATEHELLEAIRGYAEIVTVQPPKGHVAPDSPPARRIFHVVEMHKEKNAAEARRKREAQASWDHLYAHCGVIPCHYWEPYKRSAQVILRDPRDLPYLKDVFQKGMDQADDDDIIMFSNDDNFLHPALADMVRYHCSLWEICCSQRCEFVHGTHYPPLTRPPSDFAAMSKPHMGRDMFAFTKRWLVQNWEEIPDMVIGASDWDLCYAAMVRLRWGYTTTRKSLETIMWPAELPRGYVAHQYHPPRWLAPGHVNSDPSQIHNRKLFRAFAAKHLPNLRFTQDNTI